jgi:hypothetical protein
MRRNGRIDQSAGAFLLNLAYITFCFPITTMQSIAKMKSFFTILYLLSAMAAIGQDTISNAGMNYWHGGFFHNQTDTSHRVGCCGIALGVPQDWGIPEQLMAMPTNRFTFKETDTADIYSGSFSARLVTFTTDRDSAGDVSGNVAVLVPGRVTCAGIVGYGGLGIMGDLYQTIAYSRGRAFTDTPAAISFYMKMRHDYAADTALYAYAFTRWDSVNHTEDTLAYRQVDIADAGQPYDQWVRFVDTIQYIKPGLPDTLHLIFYGGRNGDSARTGNVTWLDNIQLYHNIASAVNTGISHLSSDHAVSVYPNPATSMLHIRVPSYTAGYSLSLYDLTGQRVMYEAIPAAQSSYAITALPAGLYLYRITDGSAATTGSGKLIVKD